MQFSYVQLLDNLSGVVGMAAGWSESTPVPVPNAPQYPQTGYLDVTAPQDSSGLWFGIRSVDAAGNPSESSESGPYLIDTVRPNPPTNLASIDESGSLKQQALTKFDIPTQNRPC